MASPCQAVPLPRPGLGGARSSPGVTRPRRHDGHHGVLPPFPCQTVTAQGLACKVCPRNVLPVQGFVCARFCLRNILPAQRRGRAKASPGQDDTMRISPAPWVGTGPVDMEINGALRRRGGLSGPVMGDGRSPCGHHRVVVSNSRMRWIHESEIPGS